MDEDKIDEAVAVVYDKLLNSEKFASDEAGGAKVNMVANIAIVKSSLLLAYCSAKAAALIQAIILLFPEVRVWSD